MGSRKRLSRLYRRRSAILALRGKHERSKRWRLTTAVLVLALAVPVLVFATSFHQPASADTVNTTIHVPANVQINPCTPGDIVNLSGDIHTVIRVDADAQGGYHAIMQLNSQFSGASIVTGLKYINSETKEDEWYARDPFPVIHTNTYDFELLSSSGFDNYVLHMTMHVTINSNGVPTATVDKFWMDCKG